MGTDREINNLLNEFLQLETDEQRRQFQGKIAHTLSGKTEEEKREFAEILSNKAQQTIDQSQALIDEYDFKQALKVIMEIERKYLISHIPFDIAGYPFHQIEQAYLSTAPVVRVRQEDDTYYLTYKSKGLMAREEYNLPLTKESYEHLRSKADGRILTKKRYLIPMEGTGYTIELDIFLGEYEGLKLAEVEFPSEEAAHAFVPPEWFGREVTFTGEYQNSRLALAEKLVLKTKE